MSLSPEKASGKSLYSGERIRNGGEKMSVSVVYWSGTGNTQAMAEAVAEGIRAAGAEADVMEVANADAAALVSENAFALGCPSMAQSSWKRQRWSPSWRHWSLWYPERRSCFSVLMAGRRRVDERLDGAHEECRCCTCER